MSGRAVTACGTKGVVVIPDFCRSAALRQLPLARVQVVSFVLIFFVCVAEREQKVSLFADAFAPCRLLLVPATLLLFDLRPEEEGKVAAAGGRLSVKKIRERKKKKKKNAPE